MRQRRLIPGKAIEYTYAQDDHGAKLEITCMRCNHHKTLISTDIIDIEASIKHYTEKHQCKALRQS